MKKLSPVKKFGLLSISLLGFSSSVLAHSPYLMPNVFDAAESGVVTLDATMGEHYFVPDRAFTGSNFTVTLPDGSAVTPENMVEFKTRTVLEHTLEEDGTYRFSTGWRVGGVVTSYELDGRTRRLRGEDAEIPEGGKFIESYRSSAMAETFVTKGAPTEKALLPSGEGLEFVFDSHPNEVFAGEELSFKVMVNGSTVKDVSVDIYLGERQAESSPSTYSLISDQNGGLSFTPEKAGIYVVKSRHTIASVGQEPGSRYTYSLVFEVTE